MSATLLIVCVGAIPVVAKYLGGVESVGSAMGARKHTALPLLDGATVQIIDWTGWVQAHNLGGLGTENVAHRWRKCVAGRDPFTARVTVFVVALETTTGDVLRIWSGDEATGTLVSDALALLGATFVEVSGGAILIVT
jgi:hypothetical protein